jgi:hypothetical protein
VRGYAGVFSLETTFEWLRHTGPATRAWQLDEFLVSNSSPTAAEIADLPTRTPYDDSLATRTALDVDVIPGLITLTAGYSLSSHPALHTAAFGIEARFAEMLFILGYARQLSPGRTERVIIDSPLAMDPSSISGRSRARAHSVALAFEMTFPD